MIGRACIMVVAIVQAYTSLPASAGERINRVFGLTPLGDVSLRVLSMQELKFAGVVRQRFDFSCGSAALATLLRLYGIGGSEADSFRGMWADGDRAQIRKLGFSLLDMKRYLAGRGLVANGYKVSLDAIAEAELPGIALITTRGYRHFVVLMGVDDDEVLVADPALGLRVERRDHFAASWNGVYFAIDGEPRGSKARFNQPRQWAAYARAPIGSRIADPLSIQALALTAPSVQDF